LLTLLFLDFDLCHSCYSIVEENHPDHLFITHLVGTQAADKNRQKNTTTSGGNVPHIDHKGVQCDHCQLPIQGIRYKVNKVRNS
jgi:hypothetical protein